MKPFSDYDKTQAYTEFETLPKGGYVLTVLNAVELVWPSGGKYIQIACDILEGEYTSFYAKQYKDDKREDKRWKCNFNLTEPADDGSERDAYIKRRFKTVMNAFEDSNPGYHWDWNETALKGKKIGGLFNIRQYKKSNGDIGEVTNLAALIAVDKIYANDYKLPKDKLIEPETTASDFQSVSTIFDDALPFS